MVALSLMIEGQNGLTWPIWKRIVADAETLGFAGLFRSDHFTNGQGPLSDSLEMVVSLAYVADNTQRIHFGPLVAPFSFRHPSILARQAAALDDLSGGRMILGVGAGWQEREHNLFGFELGDVPTRMQRLDEGLQVVTGLLRSDELVTFEGQHFQLHDAVLLPRPQRHGGPPILIGGNGPKRTLPLVARYADIWNAIGISPSEFRERSAELDGLLQQAGREPQNVRRTLMTNLAFGRDAAAVERKLQGVRQRPELAGKSTDEVVEWLRTTRGAIVGTPEQVIEQIKAYGEAGVDEIMLQWLDFDDHDGIRTLAETVLPHV